MRRACARTLCTHLISLHSASLKNNDISYDDLCAIGWEGYKAGKGACRTDRECGVVERELMNRRVTGEMMEARKVARKAVSQIGRATGTREAKARARARGPRML